MLLSGRVAVVTGAGRGIGRAFALCLAQEGAAVVVDDIGASIDGSSPWGTLRPASARILQAGGRAVVCRESVAAFDGARRIVQTAVREFGRLDIVVNNAGILRNRRLVDMSEEDFDTVVGVHLKGAFNVARHAVPVMQRQGYGRILNITSEGGIQGNERHTSYCAAKSGVLGMTFVWALELADHGITVNALAPQAETRMTAGRMRRLGRQGRPVGDPALNAPLVAFLASDRAAHVNGQVFGRAGFAYTLFQRSRPIATMWKHGAWTPQEVAMHFPAALGKHLQPVGRAAVTFGPPGRRG